MISPPLTPDKYDHPLSTTSEAYPSDAESIELPSDTVKALPAKMFKLYPSFDCQRDLPVQCCNEHSAHSQLIILNTSLGHVFQDSFCRSNIWASLQEQCPLTTPQVYITGRCGSPSAQAVATPFECSWLQIDKGNSKTCSRVKHLKFSYSSPGASPGPQPKQHHIQTSTRPVLLSLTLYLQCSVSLLLLGSSVLYWIKPLKCGQQAKYV